MTGGSTSTPSVTWRRSSTSRVNWKRATTMSDVATTQVFRVWIKAAPERIWAAITDPEWNRRYGFAAPSFFELKPGGAYHAEANEGMKAFGRQNGFEVPDTIIDGEVLESDPP